jgi:hypothetical protein
VADGSIIGNSEIANTKKPIDSSPEEALSYGEKITKP